MSARHVMQRLPVPVALAALGLALAAGPAAAVAIVSRYQCDGGVSVEVAHLLGSGGDDDVVLLAQGRMVAMSPVPPAAGAGSAYADPLGGLGWEEIGATGRLSRTGPDGKPEVLAANCLMTGP